MTRSDAYVLVQTDGHTDPIARSLLDLPGVVEAEDVQGPYDAVVRVRPDGAVASVAGIVDEIRALPGVLHALAAPLVPAEAMAEEPSLTAA
ncbi:MAG TPA: Lrp/AsnC ligand binding domain-containing protein [Actinomycetota bacterium]|nr:Lrp/AsnC ligand binding domain-containing protein [Actinomycetota bacterium]